MCEIWLKLVGAEISLERASASMSPSPPSLDLKPNRVVLLWREGREKSLTVSLCELKWIIQLCKRSRWKKKQTARSLASVSQYGVRTNVLLPPSLRKWSKRSKGPLRPVLKINLLGKELTPRRSMGDRGSRSWAPDIQHSSKLTQKNQPSFAL